MEAHAKFDPSISRTRIHMRSTDEGYHHSVRAELYCLRQGDYQAAGIIGYARRPSREDGRVYCPRCDRPTAFDRTYGDLCYRCCRAGNE